MEEFFRLLARMVRAMQREPETSKPTATIPSLQAPDSATLRMSVEPWAPEEEHEVRQEPHLGPCTTMIRAALATLDAERAQAAADRKNLEARIADLELNAQDQESEIDSLMDDAREGGTGEYYKTLYARAREELAARRREGPEYLDGAIETINAVAKATGDEQCLDVVASVETLRFERDVAVKKAARLEARLRTTLNLLARERAHNDELKLRPAEGEPREW